MKKCLIAMSGGVDSAAAAHIMQDAGFTCVACTLTLCGDGHVEDAREAAGRMGLEFHVFAAEEIFRRYVMEDFARCYDAGMTPNPCIVCNRQLKFGFLLEKAEELGCQALVTGHYARVEQDAQTGRFLLKKALDEARDQSYMLCSLTQRQLAFARFPLGMLTKAQTRSAARSAGLPNAEKQDSQDICFVPDGDYAGFLERFTGNVPKAGNFVMADGRVLGPHKGIRHYTVGQRRGLGIAWEHPLYVQRICPETGNVLLGKDEALYSRSLQAKQVNFIALDALDAPIRCKAKIRYRHKEQPCTAYMEGDVLCVTFDEAQRAITPGQSVVLYRGDTVLAAGIIV